ncbi:hypothetical protein [Metabacillus litoralis]|uniref:Uncharacterized protein n=1 Tax=Metabacillus litoralis TaxID=152268 RepID=A0A179SUB5_9BACI|nr:hypothetical protein [Metabacillus litoralis]OAS85111.1 hypothetical protein A6K24_06260 [Metabacillus litoralis]
MNTYIALYKSEFSELAGMVRIEANDIWEAYDKAHNYLKAHYAVGYKKEYLISVEDVKKLTLVK